MRVPRITLYGILFFWLLLFSIVSCRKDLPLNEVNNESLMLKWNKAYDSESKQEVNLGLKWVLLNLGARLEKGSFEQCMQWTSDSELRFTPALAGYPEPVLKIWRNIIHHMKADPAYMQRGCLDLGRWIAICLNSSPQYYALTQMPKNYQLLLGNKAFHAQPMAVSSSTISQHKRIINLPDSLNWLASRQLFTVAEGDGVPGTSGFKVIAYEVLDLMENGQYRFGVYDTLFNLINGLPMQLGSAGKPAKCLWCHEQELLPNYFGGEDIQGFMGREEFDKRIEWFNAQTTQYRNKLSSEIDFSKRQDHASAELLYLSFMHPNIQRISREWNLPVQEVEKRLQGLEAVTYDEYPFLGLGYQRAEVDARSPIKEMPAPFAERNTLGIDPDYTQPK